MCAAAMFAASTCWSLASAGPSNQNPQCTIGSPRKTTGGTIFAIVFVCLFAGPIWAPINDIMDLNGPKETKNDLGACSVVGGLFSNWGLVKKFQTCLVIWDLFSNWVLV